MHPQGLQCAFLGGHIVLRNSERIEVSGALQVGVRDTTGILLPGKITRLAVTAAEAAGKVRATTTQFAAMETRKVEVAKATMLTLPVSSKTQRNTRLGTPNITGTRRATPGEHSRIVQQAKSMPTTLRESTRRTECARSASLEHTHQR